MSQLRLNRLWRTLPLRPHDALAGRISRRFPLLRRRFPLLQPPALSLDLEPQLWNPSHSMLQTVHLLAKHRNRPLDLNEDVRRKSQQSAGVRLAVRPVSRQTSSQSQSSHLLIRRRLPLRLPLLSTGSSIQLNRIRSRLSKAVIPRRRPTNRVTRPRQLFRPRQLLRSLLQGKRRAFNPRTRSFLGATSFPRRP